MPQTEPPVSAPVIYDPQPLTPEQAAKIQQRSLTIQAEEAIARCAANGQSSTDWQQYKAALEAVSSQSGFPLDITWPIPPSS
jgi:hypothetical protein